MLYTFPNLFNSDTAYDLYVFDADNGKSQISRTLSGIGEKCLIDIIYNPKTDTVLTFSDTYLDGYELGQPYIAEFSLSDDGNIIWKSFSFEPGGTGFIGVFENIVSVISAKDDRIEYFDFLNPPRSITLANNDSSKGINLSIGYAISDDYIFFAENHISLKNGSFRLYVLNTATGVQRQLTLFCRLKICTYLQCVHCPMGE